MTNTTPREFRRRFSTHRLVRRQCEYCNRFNDATDVRCYRCGSTELDPVELTPRGTVLTFVVQYYLPPEFDTPLPLGIVETPEGAKVMGMFTETDPADVEIGTTVGIELKRVTREGGHVVYEPKFRPVVKDV